LKRAKLVAPDEKRRVQHHRASRLVSVSRARNRRANGCARVWTQLIDDLIDDSLGDRTDFRFFLALQFALEEIPLPWRRGRGAGCKLAKARAQRRDDAEQLLVDAVDAESVLPSIADASQCGAEHRSAVAQHGAHRVTATEQRNHRKRNQRSVIA